MNSRVQKVVIIGGSNSVLKHSYVRMLHEDRDFKFENRAVGGTNSIYALIQLYKYNLFDSNDIVIFEYFVNDMNHYFQQVNHIGRVHRTLLEIIRLCIEHNKKLLFILNYNQLYMLKNKFIESPMYRKYQDILERYGVPYIDTFCLLAKTQENWIDFFEDSMHLNERGMQLLAQEVKRRLRTLPSLFYDETLDYRGFNGVKILQMNDTFENVSNMTNSLISVDYAEINDKMTLRFDKKTSILALEYLCDKHSGYIEICNGDTIIQKNTLKNESFVLDAGKSMVSLVTLNRKQFEASDCYTIRMIDRSCVQEEYYDKERITFEATDEVSTSFKLVSVLLTENSMLNEGEFS